MNKETSAATGPEPEPKKKTWKDFTIGQVLQSDMCPQRPKFNRQIWRLLEIQVRDLATMFEEVSVVCGPLFDVGQTITVLDSSKVPVPHSFFKSIPAEPTSGELKLRSFVMPNQQAPVGAC